MKAKKKRAYDASGRREEAERTRERIVEAAAKLLHSVRPENLSYGDIAERSGVAIRTVYRHFPETPELLRAVAQATFRRFAPDGLSPVRALWVEQFAEYHRQLSAEPSLFRVFMAAPIRGETDLQRYVRTTYRDELEGLSPEKATAVAALLELFASPFAWEVLHSHWQLPPELITQACLAAAQFVVDGARRHPEWLDPESGAPPLFRPAKARSSTKKERT